MVAYFVLGRAPAARRRLPVAALLLALAVPLVAASPGTSHVVGVGSVWLFFIGAPFAAGLWVGRGTRLASELRENVAELDRRQRERARHAASDERARIARELHDVVAHNVSVMVVQADGASYALDRSPERARQALAAISSTGRQALEEMRRMLGVLRSAAEQSGVDPLPGIGELGELLDQTRAAGLAVSFAVEGVPAPLPDGVALAAYRTVQESLTNVRKHGGPAATAQVVLRYCEDALVLVITDDGRGAAAMADGAGHGLIGMRERIAVYGGSLRAGPRPGGGYQVSASFPLAASRAAAAGAA
jgi:signal transduction histidine kinase